MDIIILHLSQTVQLRIKPSEALFSQDSIYNAIHCNPICVHVEIGLKASCRHLSARFLINLEYGSDHACLSGFYA